MWPGGVFGSRGRIAPDQMAEAGRALVFADAPEWREVVRTAFGPDAPANDELLTACVDLLRGWSATWSARPEVVVALPVAGHPLLTRSVADHLATVGRLARADLDVDATVSASADQTSAAEAAAWRDAIRVGPDTAAAIGGRVVLLVVDASSTQWPITVAAAALRTAGASRVLPLLLHRRP
jgi:ATP-dependent DNA helicase RecQ